MKNILFTLILLCSTSYIYSQKKSDKPLSASEKRIQRLKAQLELIKTTREAIPYYKFKYEKPASEKLQDLEREKKRYEAGLAKLQKGSKKYKARHKEYNDILNKIKAQKILIIYPKILTAQLDAHDKKDSENFAKHQNTCFDLQSKYKEYSGDNFPNFLGEYTILKDRKKKRTEKTSKKRTASTK
jgi:hypothetical protein